MVDQSGRRSADTMAAMLAAGKVAQMAVDLDLKRVDWLVAQTAAEKVVL